MSVDGSNAALTNPLWLLAELTYRCPLHCVYCSNPVDFARYDAELSTEDWLRVFREARALGVAQLGFSGGEPLARNDLELLIRGAHELGFYTNLITSGVGLGDGRTARLREAGLDHVQLSFQDSTPELNDFLSHTRTFDLKLRVARLLKEAGYPIVLNVVLHRQNIDHIEQILELAARLEVDYLELANTQFYGWAFLNREQLIPTREQVLSAERATNRFRQRAGNRVKIYFVVSDYHEKRPKPCMNGWGSMYIAVAPDGVAMPCNQARVLPGLEFPNVKEKELAWIWRHSAAFNRFRGDDWMSEPCRSCPERIKDFGGCRCQAYLLTGDPANTDPVCELSPNHQVVLDVVERAERRPQAKPLHFRGGGNPRPSGPAPSPSKAE